MEQKSDSFAVFESCRFVTTERWNSRRAAFVSHTCVSISLFHLPSLVNSGSGGRGGAGGASAHLKVLICQKFWQKPWISEKISENLGKNRAQHCLISNNGTGDLFLKSAWGPFFWVHTKQGLYDICRWKFVGKVAQKRFGQVWVNSGKNPSHPQKFACSYTYAREYHHDVI